MEASEIIEGYFGDVRLDGLRSATVYRWPGAVHEGGGAALTVIDERASEVQREALLTIFSGKEQEPTTAFSIYGSTIETDHGVVYAPIEFEWDFAGRAGRFAVRDVLEAALEPIRNPVTGQPHRASIKLPHGFEFREAEMASSTMRSHAPLPQSYEKCYGFLTITTYGPQGIIEEHSYPAVNT
jgi:hypothetical protein